MAWKRRGSEGGGNSQHPPPHPSTSPLSKTSQGWWWWWWRDWKCRFVANDFWFLQSCCCCCCSCCCCGYHIIIVDLCRLFTTINSQAKMHDFSIDDVLILKSVGSLSSCCAVQMHNCCPSKAPDSFVLNLRQMLRRGTTTSPPLLR